MYGTACTDDEDMHRSADLSGVFIFYATQIGQNQIHTEFKVLTSQEQNIPNSLKLRKNDGFISGAKGFTSALQ